MKPLLSRCLLAIGRLLHMTHAARAADALPNTGGKRGATSKPERAPLRAGGLVVAGLAALLCAGCEDVEREEMVRPPAPTPEATAQAPAQTPLAPPKEDGWFQKRVESSRNSLDGPRLQPSGPVGERKSDEDKD